MSQEDAKVIGNGVLVILAFLMIVMTLGQFVKDRVRWIQAPTLGIMLGIFLGGLLLIGGDSSLILNTKYNIEFFLVFLLSPIIFEGGYNLEKKSLFKHLGGTLLFALLGTLISTLTVSIILFFLANLVSANSLTYPETLAFAALISATEPGSMLPIIKEMNIENRIVNMISGESTFNQIVAISLYTAIVKSQQTDLLSNMIAITIGNLFLVLFGSMFIGIAIAASISFLLSRMETQGRFNLEACLMMFGPWIAFLIANVAKLSGLVSILFCGIFMARYTYPNLSELTKAVIGKTYSALANGADIIAYIFLGMALFVFDLEFKQNSWSLIGISLLAAVIGRALCVAICANLMNLFIHQKMSWKVQMLICLSGLRGVISFGLAVRSSLNLQNGDEIMLMSVVFIIINRVIGGAAVPLMLSYLNITQQSNQTPKILLVGEDGHENCFKKMKRGMLWIDDYLYQCLVRENKEMSSGRKGNPNSDRSQFVHYSMELNFMPS